LGGVVVGELETGEKRRGGAQGGGGVSRQIKKKGVKRKEKEISMKKSKTLVQ